MKNLCSLLVLFLLGGTILNAQIQKSHWAMHPNEIDFTTTPITNPALGSFSFNYTAGNSAYDPQGNLLFYVYNNHVYDASNNLAGTLTDYFSGPNYPTNIMYQGVEHEIAIVPFSEECEKYYVIYLTPGSEFVNPPNGNNMHQALLYSIVEVSGTTVTVTSQTGTHTSMLIDRFNPGNLGGIAVSPELEEGGRYLFCVAGTEVNRYFIDDSGISFEETIIRIDDMDLESFTFDLTELELYWNGDPDNFEGRLGWGQLNNSMVSTTSAITIDLDISGNYSAHTITNFDDLNSIVGFEFNPDNYDQFFICARDLGGSTGIYWQTINKRGPNYVEDSENYWSHIELARDGEMYIAEYSSGNPASFDPLSTPYFISSTSLSNFKSDQNASFVGAASLHGFFTLPDQIDGVNNTFYLDPVSDFTVNSTSLPNSFSFLPQFNVCQPIIMDDLCENGNSYKVSLVQLNGSGNPIGSPPSQSWSSTLNTNLKNIPYDLFTTLNSSQATGNFKVTVEVKNICGIIDTKVGYFSTIAPFVSFSGLSIGGEYLVTSLPDNDVTQTYSCASQDIILDYNYWNGNQYRVKLESVTSSGSLITGAGELGSKTTSWYSNFASIEDLKDLPLSAPYGTWLTDASHAGYYKVTLSVQRQCGGVDDFVGYFYLNAPPSPANMLLTIHNSQNGTSTCSTKNLNSQCITGNGSPAFSLGISGSTFSTNNITFHKLKRGYRLFFKSRY